MAESLCINFDAVESNLLISSVRANPCTYFLWAFKQLEYLYLQYFLVLWVNFYVVLCKWTQIDYFAVNFTCTPGQSSHHLFVWMVHKVKFWLSHTQPMLDIETMSRLLASHWKRLGQPKGDNDPLGMQHACVTVCMERNICCKYKLCNG